MTVGERVKLRRNELQMSVDEVAKAINKDRSTVYRYESREIEELPLSILVPLAKALKTTPAYLMGWEEQSDLTAHEHKVISAYRQKPEMQPAVDRLLGIEEEKLIPSLVAARSKNNDVPIHIENVPDLSKFPVDDTEL